MIIMCDLIPIVAALCRYVHVICTLNIHVWLKEESV
jgi:hypothetical protein